ncbi:MAG: SDR family oxidoreductase [bacterium]
MRTPRPPIRTALVTGGTRGIGLATGLALGRRGVRCVLTWRFGSADEAEVQAHFEAIGAPPPIITRADVSSPDDTAALFADLRQRLDGIDALVLNAGGAPLADDWRALDRRALHQSLSYSAWPVIDHLREAERAFGRLPRYVVAMSSTGPDDYTLGYDYMAAAKAALEVLCRYLARHLRDDDVRVNVVRSRAVRTETFDRAFGGDFAAFVARVAPHAEAWWVSPEEVADVAVALCSGLLDGVSGQVLTVDRGGSSGDDSMNLFAAQAAAAAGATR